MLKSAKRRFFAADDMKLYQSKKEAVVSAIASGIISGFGLGSPTEDKKLTTVNDIVWELSHRGIITATDLWLKKLKEDTNAYWLARKTVKLTIYASSQLCNIEVAAFAKLIAQAVKEYYR